MRKLYLYGMDEGVFSVHIGFLSDIVAKFNDDAAIAL